MIPLKYNTASQEIPLGHFVDDTDGKTAETGLTIANTDIKLWKNGATTLANKNSGGATHISGGVYYATLDATDTNTYGPMKIFVHVSGALPCILECLVMEANAYDAMYAALGTGYMEANAVQISGDSTAADNAESFFDGTGYAGTNNVIPTVTTLTGHTGQTGDNFARLGAPAGASVSADIAAIEAQTDDIGAAGAGLTALPWNAAWDAEVQSEVTDALVAMFTSAAQLVDDVWDEVLTGATHNVVNSAGRRLRNLQDFGVYEGGAIWIDTVNGVAGTTDYENGTVNNPVDTIADALTLAASVGLSAFHVLPGSSITLAASVDNYQFKGYGYSVALGGQSLSGTSFENATITGNDDGSNGTATRYIRCAMGSNTLGKNIMIGCQFTGDLVLAEAADYFWDQCYSGVAGTGTPSVDLESAAETKNLSIRHYSGGMEFKNHGAGSGTHNTSIEGFGQVVLNANCAGGTIAIRGNFTVTDNAGGAVTLSDNARIDIDQVADQVWEEAIADHSGTAGSTAEALDAAGGGVTAAAIADAVWDELATGHTDAGKAGAQLWTDVDAILADTNELQTDDVPGLIAALPTAVENRTEMDSNSTQLTAIVADTNELQADWTNGGRLDLIIDAILADTNELQTDDVPGLIAALNDLSAAEINTEVDTAFTTIMADSVPADGTIPTREQALYMITQFLLERSVSGTTVTVKKVDGSTSLMTLTLDDGTTPTSITRAT
jgi:hypothetical protein